MSLNTSLSIATSGLKATQSQLSTVSNNIANADSAGYTKKTAGTQSVVVSGQGAGVQVAETTSAVNQNLLRQRDGAASTLGEAEVTASYSDALQSSLGSTDGDDTLSDAINGLANAIDALAVTPESSSESAIVVHEAERLAGEVNALSDEIQDLRGQADKDIAESVDDVNAALHRIDDLNRQIADNEARGLSTADLEDQRAMELEALSRELDVTYFTNTKNQVQIYTSSGTPLLDSAVHELQFSAASSVDSAIVYNPGGGSGLSGITVEGKDITGEITSGEIGGLLDLRDESLVDRQAEVDALTQTLADSVNAAHNQGTSLPAPSSLTGTTTVNGSDPLTASGTFRVAILDADGTVQQSTDLDLSLYATYSDLVAAIDAIPGASAAIDAQGRISVTADDPSLGIVFNEMNSAAGPDAEGLSTHLGLNDLYEVDGAGRISVRGDIAENPDLLATGTLSDTPALAAGDIGLTSGDASSAERLAAALNDSHSFDAAGGLGASSTSIAGYAAEMTAAIANMAENAGSEAQTAQLIYDDLVAGIAAQAGVNIDEETAELSLLENNYSAMANVIQVIQEMYDTLMQMV